MFQNIVLPNNLQPESFRSAEMPNFLGKLATSLKGELAKLPKDRPLMSPLLRFLVKLLSNCVDGIPLEKFACPEFPPLQCFTQVAEALQSLGRENEVARQFVPFLRFLKEAAGVLHKWIEEWKSKEISMAILKRLMEDKGEHLRQVCHTLHAAGVLQAQMPTSGMIEAWHQQAMDYRDRIVNYRFPKCKKCPNARR